MRLLHRPKQTFPICAAKIVLLREQQRKREIEMVRLIGSALAALWLLGFAAGADAEQEGPAGHAHGIIDQDSSPVENELIAPFFSLHDEAVLTLVAVSGVNAPVDLVVNAYFPDGRVLPLGRFTLPPSRHWSLDLDGAISSADDSFERGSITVSFMGVPETVQVWLLSQKGDHLSEFKLAAREEVASRKLLSFWPEGGVPSGTQRSLYLLNAGTAPLNYTVLLPFMNFNQERVRPGAVQPGEQQRISLGASRQEGVVIIEHDRNPGDLLAQVVVEGKGYVSKLPVWPVPSSSATKFVTLDVPSDVGDKIRMGLYNSRQEAQGVEIQVRSWKTGNVIQSLELILEPEELRSLVLTAPLGGQSEGGDEHLRIGVSAEVPGLLVHGLLSTADSKDVELSFHGYGDAHGSGSYPLLPVTRYDTRLALLNLGTESSEIIGQLYWEGGSYAFGPLTLEGYASRTVSVGELIELAEPDLLGRTVPAELVEGGLLKWKVHRGSRKLVGRAMATASGTTDRVGFNCLGCCWERPRGSVAPGYVAFDVGQSPSFEAAFSYDTCNGTMGPFALGQPGSMTVPSPFSWNGSNVTASASAEELLSFTEWGDEVFSDCSVMLRAYKGVGTADACKILLRKSHNLLQSWDVQKACSVEVQSESTQKCARCHSCCEAKKAYWTCKKKAAHLVQSDYSGCMGNCDTGPCL